MPAVALEASRSGTLRGRASQPGRRESFEALRLVENQERLRANAVGLHRIGGRLRLHELLKGSQVRDLRDQSDAV